MNTLKQAARTITLDEIETILLDEGCLTNVRTTAAGAVAAPHLAPAKLHRIGILGAGYQGRMQLEYLKAVVACQDIQICKLISKAISGKQ